MSDIVQNTLFHSLGDGARPTKFRVQIMPPQSLLNKYNLKIEDLDIQCTSTKLPSVSSQVIDYKFKGRNIPLPGFQEYDQTWTCTFYNMENNAIRRLLIDWLLSNKNHQYFNNATSMNKMDWDYTMIHIYQLDYEYSKTTQIVSCVNAFPTSVGEIELNAESLNQIQTFNVEFRFSHFEINTISINGKTANDIAQEIQSAVQKITNNIVKSISNTLKNKVINPLFEAIGNSKVGKFFGSSFESLNDFLDN